MAGNPLPYYEDFMTGFVVANHDVWGRPVGVAVGADGSLFVSEDANRTIWPSVYLYRDDALRHSVAVPFCPRSRSP